MFFIGVVLSTIIAPPLADAYGRKLVVFFSYIIMIAGLIGLMIKNSIVLLDEIEGNQSAGQVRAPTTASWPPGSRGSGRWCSARPPRCSVSCR